MNAKEDNMDIDVEEFSLDMSYDKKNDTLRVDMDREIKNGDILVILIHILSMVDKENRNDILDLALAVLQERELQNVN